MARHTTLASLFTDIANAIRLKTGETAPIKADNFDQAIGAIGTDPSYDADATADDLLYPKIAYANGLRLVGNIVTKNASGNVTLSGSTLTKSYDAGYYPNAHGAKIEIDTKETIVPTTSQQTVNAASGKVMSSITVGAIPNQKPDSGNVTLSGSTLSKSYAAGYYPNAHGAQIVVDQKDPVTPAVSAQTIQAESGKVLGPVTINPIPNQKSDTGNTVLDITTQSKSFPAGYYANQHGAIVSLETKNVTPSVNVQTVTPTSGKLISQVNVGAIPNQKSDSGNVTLDTASTSKSYPAGYYPNVHGAQIVLETKSVVPSSSSQDIIPSAGKVLSKVTVGAVSTQSKTITGNGVVYPDSGKYLSSVTVAIPVYDGTII